MLETAYDSPETSHDPTGVTYSLLKEKPELVPSSLEPALVHINKWSIPLKRAGYVVSHLALFVHRSYYCKRPGTTPLGQRQELQQHLCIDQLR
jgi:hypothetical protein